MAALGDKKTLYVGGLHESVDEKMLMATFIPFGDLTHVQIPVDAKTHKHRGFGFVTYGDRQDAVAAMDNMHLSELYGRVLNVRTAKPQALKHAHTAVWDTDQFTEVVLEEGASASTNN